MKDANAKYFEETNSENDQKSKGSSFYSNGSNSSSISQERMHFFCNKCNTVPTIKFISFDKAHYSCLCREIKDLLDIKIIKNKIFGEENNNNVEDENNKNKIIIKNNKECLYCQVHYEQFAYFCSTCNKNICRKCLRKPKIIRGIY